MMFRVLTCGAVAIGLLAAQTAARFEVASIKPSVDFQAANRTGHLGIKIDPARVDIGYWSLRQLIYRAYGIWGYQLAGPDWLGTERFDVVATFPQGTTENQLPEMLQRLLADRFGLKAHMEKKDVQGYVLTVAKGGPKMKLTAQSDDETGLNRVARTGRLIDQLSSYEASTFGITNITRAGGVIHTEFTKMPMAALVQILASYLAAPVADMTGLTGKYQAALDFSLPVTQAASSSGDAANPSGATLFSTVQRLGLKLERRKIPTDMLVVDHMERTPTAN